MRDFFSILEGQDWYDPAYHNKSTATYQLFGNFVEFISVDQPQKVRGRKRNILFINEANELTLEDWRQLLLRTTHRVILDFNPSDAFHWLYDEVIPRDDATLFKTTYLDNPFLEPEVIAEIERFKEGDPDFWRVYGLGERGVGRSIILTHWQGVDRIPSDWDLVAYGLDFGYTNDPSTLVGVWTDGHSLAVSELFYATGMTNADLAREIRNAGVGRTDLLVADSAEPKSIDELRGAGFNIHPARKGPDSVRSGLDYLRSRPLLVTNSSVNLVKELQNYRWREDKNGHQLNEPEPRGWDHAIDALRYAATWAQAAPNYGRYTLG